MSEDNAPTRREWEQARSRSLDKTPERLKRFETGSGIEIKDLYTADDLGDTFDAELGYPGLYPYTRGVHPGMYRGRLWTMRQYSGFGDAEQTNRRFRYLLEQGQSGLSVAFDLPTQMGYDSDHAMAAGEVGKVGVAIDSLEDMQTLLEGIPLDRVSTSMTINSTAAILLCFYIAVAKQRGIEPRSLSGTIQNDLLKEYIARGTYIYPPAASLRITSDIFAYCQEHLPRWNTISISGYHMREAGATAVQEVAFTLANAIAYSEAAIERFEEAAKFRAARRMWAHIVRERFGVADPELCRLRFHTQTAGSTLTAQQPEVNLVRTALQALSAVLGGTQSLHTNALDEALGLPTEKTALLALRSQQVIAHETGVGDTVDPLAGSYFVESLTDSIESRALEYIERIDTLGGAVRAIEMGFQQREIHEAAFLWQKKVESGEGIVVGVNRFVEGQEPHPPLLKVDETLQRRATERLAGLRATRDAVAVERALAAVETAARDESNLVPPILAAIECCATLGEISDRMRKVFGVHQEAFAF